PMPTAAILSVLSRVSPAVGEPLHRQVEARIRRLAALPEFKRGALLPDEVTMAGHLGVSRGTARAALARLVHDGVLERTAGVGTKVAHPRGEAGLRARRRGERRPSAQGADGRTAAASVSYCFGYAPAPDRVCRGALCLVAFHLDARFAKGIGVSRGGYDRNPVVDVPGSGGAIGRGW